MHTTKLGACPHMRHNELWGFTSTKNLGYEILIDFQPAWLCNIDCGVDKSASKRNFYLEKASSAASRKGQFLTGERQVSNQFPHLFENG